MCSWLRIPFTCYTDLCKVTLRKTDFPLPSLEHLVNLLKVSFAIFVYAQTHNRAAAQLTSITVEAGTD